MESQCTGKLLSDWQSANVTPVFKKGDSHLPENYRPVSLTCISCTLLEHIICKHILNHLENNKILTIKPRLLMWIPVTNHFERFTQKLRRWITSRHFLQSIWRLPLIPLYQICLGPHPTPDLHELEKWATKWGMRFNANKCYVMSINQKSSHFYQLDNQILKQVEVNPYLGVILLENLKFSPHIRNITKKANSTLGFLKRKLKHCSKSCKKTASLALLRSTLEYRL